MTATKLNPQVLFLILPFLVQGLAIMIDEFYFHLRRGLPKWERVGHPLDTLSVLICFLVVLAYEPTALTTSLFGGLAVFSCLFVTKDEWVHSRTCSATENWLHSLLFIIHPVVFVATGLVWILRQHDTLPTALHFEHGSLELLWTAIQVQTVIVFSFFIFQTTYWNFIWKPNRS